MTNQYERYFGGMKSTNNLPHPIIRPFIFSYNFHENSKINGLAQLCPKPNGYVVLNINYNGSCLAVLKYREEKKFTNLIAGIHGLNVTTRLRPLPYNNLYQGLTITFTLAGISRLIPAKLSELTNNIVTMEEIWGLKGKELERELGSTNDNIEKVNILDLFFINIYNHLYHIKRKPVDYIYMMFSEKNGKISVDSIAKKLNISYRTLHRIFQNDIGLCPKEYLKIVRFNNVCSHLKNFPNIKISEVIHQTGYYDQAHFIHEFKEIMKASPQEFLNLCKGKFYYFRAYKILD